MLHKTSPLQQQQHTQCNPKPPLTLPRRDRETIFNRPSAPFLPPPNLEPIDLLFPQGSVAPPGLFSCVEPLSRSGWKLKEVRLLPCTFEQGCHQLICETYTKDLFAIKKKKRRIASTPTFFTSYLAYQL
uniref:Putative ovule protein n=1 Tax=Solanum chacoense TaxID=4108 RepID=A0A0V0INE7_SOLCH